MFKNAFSRYIYTSYFFFALEKKIKIIAYSFQKNILTTMLKYRLLFSCILLFLVSSVAYSQDDITKEDPLLNLKVWEQLVEKPNNDALWEVYFGKDLFSLDKNENEKYELWKTKLNEAKKKREEEMRMKILARRNSGKQQYNEFDYEVIVKNPLKNFGLIEDHFKKEFKKYNLSYLSYNDKHPEGTYNKISWIEDQEKKLKELKAESEQPKGN